MARKARRGRRRSVRRRVFGFLGVFVLLAGVAIAVAVLDARTTRTVSGVPIVIDGDTLVLSGQRVRLAGIDAPELEQACGRGDAEYACGRQARRYLVDLAGKARTDCTGNQEDRYGRLLARCVSATTELNSAMVLGGWAVSYGGYQREERAARDARAGIWAGTFERPAAWRARRGVAAGSRPPGIWTDGR
ncbi:MAG: hypothetical protein Kow0026_04050 [Oricola sp.]